MSNTLLEGFRRFTDAHYPLMQELLKGQNPDVFMISCIDSRSDPGIIFNAEPGVIMGHKAMAAIVRPYQKGTALSAALTYALDTLGTKDIIIMGHTGCGAVNALINGAPDPETESFIDVAQIALKRARSLHQTEGGLGPYSLNDLAETEVVLLADDNLRGYPAVKRALKQNRLTIKLWIFDMHNGQIKQFNKRTGGFDVISDRKEEPSDGAHCDHS